MSKGMMAVRWVVFGTAVFMFISAIALNVTSQITLRHQNRQLLAEYDTLYCKYLNFINFHVGALSVEEMITLHQSDSCDLQKARDLLLSQAGPSEYRSENCVPQFQLAWLKGTQTWMIPDGIYTWCD